MSVRGVLISIDSTDSLYDEDPMTSPILSPNITLKADYFDTMSNRSRSRGKLF